MAIAEDCSLFLVITQRGQFHLCLACVRAVDSSAVVTKCLLREPFRIARFLGTFRPGVAIRMEAHPFNEKPDAALLEFGRPVPCTDRSQIREKRPRGW